MLRTGSLATVTVVLGTRESSGVWTVDAGSGGRAASVTLYRCSDLRLEIVEPDEQLAGGEPGVVEAVAVDSTGAPADLTSYQGPAAGDPVTVAVTSNPESQASVTVVDPAAGRLRIELTPPDDTTAVELGLELTPRLTDAPEIELGHGDGHASSPGHASRRRSPRWRPPTWISAARSGSTRPRECWRSRGPSRGRRGSASTTPAPLRPPPSRGSNRIVSSAECLALEVGESAEIEVSVTPETSVDGEGRATLPVTLVNADGEEIQQDVALSWELERRIDQGTRLWLVAAAILISLLLLALALAVVNRLLARFAVGDVRFATVPVEIDAEGHVQPLQQVGEERPDYLYIDKSERRTAGRPVAVGDRAARQGATDTWAIPSSPRMLRPALGSCRLDGHVRGDATAAPVTCRSRSRLAAAGQRHRPACGG